MFNSYKNASTTSTTWIATSSTAAEMTAGKRRAAGGILTSHTPTHAMPISGSRKFLLAIALFVLLASVNGATDQTVKPSPTSPLSLSSSASLSATSKDDIYIDDESIEGSGGRGGLHDDLDKDPDYSGSGFGPDDEDSSTDLQPSHRGNNIHTQSGKHNTVLSTDDNDDLITSRTHHQTNSGTIIGSNSGSNSGIIGGNSGSNTGLNTIDINAIKSISLPSFISTATTTTKQTSPSTSTNQNTPTLTHHITTTTSSATAGKNRGSSLYPNQVQQTHLPAAPHYPAGGVAHTDDEDFDLGEGDDDDDAKQQLGGAGSFAGSGDGDHDDDDDDHTGDVDEDEHEGLIERPYQPKHEFGVGKEPTSAVENGTITSSTTASSTTTTGSVSSSSDSSDRKKILSSNTDEDEHDADEEDEFDDTYDEEEDNKGDDEDDADDRVHEEDDNTEVYIDGTEPNAKSGDSVEQDNERGTTNQGNTIHELDTNNVNSQPTDTKVIEHTTGNEVLIMNTSDDDRTASFFAQPGILAAVIGGAVVGLLCAILVVMFIVYRMRKKDEGSYALDEPKRSPAVNSYAKNANNREFYA
ncbi:syndecan isoform X2 [Zeugodacus cucurbitae]|uniref:syndecan isoform X2 n=1 Tax=Zeugodacus cucurbitae TaxID=28588 RepID=UPI0023D8E8C0|nr:syndecan isoform X2 [Zeugodacus cucurbitae]